MHTHTHTHIQVTGSVQTNKQTNGWRQPTDSPKT